MNKQRGEMETIALIAIMVGLLLLGAFLQNVDRNSTCEKGTPYVINGKVYVCVEKP